MCFCCWYRASGWFLDMPANHESITKRNEKHRFQISPEKLFWIVCLNMIALSLTPMRFELAGIIQKKCPPCSGAWTGQFCLSVLILLDFTIRKSLLLDQTIRIFLLWDLTIRKSSLLDQTIRIFRLWDLIIRKSLLSDKTIWTSLLWDLTIRSSFLLDITTRKSLLSDPTTRMPLLSSRVLYSTPPAPGWSRTCGI